MANVLPQYYGYNTTSKLFYNSSANFLLKSSVYDYYSQGSSLPTRAAVKSVLQYSLTTGALPVDSTGIYLIITSANVTVLSFCTAACGYHGALTDTGTSNTVYWSWVGDASTQCVSVARRDPPSCLPSSSPLPPPGFDPG